MNSLVEFQVRKFRKRYPHLADDLEQVIRLAAWRAGQTCSVDTYTARRGEWAALDWLRAWTGSKRVAGVPRFSSVDPDSIPVEPDGPEWPTQLPPVPDRLQPQLALLREVFETDGRTVARRQGVCEATLSRRVAAARQRLRRHLRVF